MNQRRFIFGNYYEVLRQSVSVFLSLSVFFLHISLFVLWKWRMLHTVFCCMTTSFINMHSGRAASLCSPSHPVVLICFFLLFQVRIWSLVSVNSVLMEASQLSSTVKTAAVAASETADQVKKQWVMSTSSTVSSITDNDTSVTFGFLR